MKNPMAKKPSKSKRIVKPSSDPITSVRQLGAKLRHLRKKRGITQQEVATFANLSRLAVSELETGKSDVKLSTLLKILNVCSLDLEMRER